MEEDMSVTSSPEDEISPNETDMLTEAMNQTSISCESSASTSQMNQSASSSGHELHGTTTKTNLLQSEDSTTTYQCGNNQSLYLLTNKLETVPALWTNIRYFMVSKPPHICRIPKQLINNGIIRQTLKFVTTKPICEFHMKLELFFKGKIINQWKFNKGWIHPNVTTNWETTFSPSKDAIYFDAKLTARTILKTKLYDGDQLLLMYDTFIIFA